jgi:hypothetical protein
VGLASQVPRPPHDTCKAVLVVLAIEVVGAFVGTDPASTASASGAASTSRPAGATSAASAPGVDADVREAL